MARRDETIRLMLEAEGAAEVQALARDVTQVASASSDAAKQADKLLDEIADVGRLKQATAQYRESVTAVRDYQIQMRAAAEAAGALSAREKELSAVEEKNRLALAAARAELSAFTDGTRAFLGTTQQVKAAQAAAREEVRRLTAEYKASATARQQVTNELERERAAAVKAAAGREREIQAARALRTSLEEAGVSVRNLSTVETQLAARAQASAGALRALATDTRAAAAAMKQAAETQAAATAAENRAIQARARAAAGLDKYRRDAELARNTTQQLGSAVDGVGSKFGKLRGFIAGALAGFSLASIVQGVKQILGLGDAAERTQKQLARMFGSAEAGAAASAAIKKFAADNGLAVDNVRAAFIKLKNFGIDPTTGALQALVDENAAMGGSQERLEGTVLALGQAWTKQKFQAEEALQLAERGVPVWDLLAKATGKSVPELLKLSEAGRLGRREIALLIAEIGKMNAGAAAESANTLSGLFTKLVGKVREFATEIANSGSMNSFKDALRGIIAQVDELASSGKLAQYAKSVSQALSTLANSLFSATKFAIEHAQAIVNLGIAYASFKTVSFVAEIGKAAAAMVGWRAAAGGANAALGATGAASAAASKGAGAAATAFGLLGRALGLIKANPIIAALTVAIGAVTVKVVELVRVNEQLADTESAVERQRKLNLAKIAFLIQAGKDYKDTAILQAQEVERLSGVEATAYAQRLARAQGYYRGLESAARMAGDQVGLKDAKDSLALIAPALELIEKRLAEIEEQAKRAKSRFGEFAVAAGDAFDTAKEKGEKARDEIAKLFSEIDLASAAGIAKIAEAITVVGSRGREASQIIQSELRQQLIKLSDSDLQKFREQVDVAFRNGVQGAAQMRAALDGINLARLGVDIEAIKNGFTESGNAAVRAFAAAVAEIKGAGLTAEQQSIATAQAFDAAFKSAATSKELEGLKAALVKAFEAGEIAAEEYRERVDQINSQLAKSTASQNLYRPPTDGLHEMGNAAKEASVQLRATGEAAKGAEQQTEEFAGRGQSFLANVMQAIQQTRSEFEAVGPAAAKSFDQVVLGLERTRTSIGAGVGFDTVAENLRIAADETRAAVADQRAQLQSLVDGLNQYAATGAGAFGSVGGTAADAAAQFSVLAQQVKEGRTDFSLLGQQDLAVLQQALDQATAKAAALQQQALSAADAIDGIADNLRNQLDEINGDREAVENRRYEEQLDQIRKQAELSGELGAQKAREAEALAAQLHAKNLERIRRENAEKNRGSGGGGGAEPPAAPERPSGGGGSQITRAAPPVQNFYFNGTFPGDKETFVRYIRRELKILESRGG